MTYQHCSYMLNVIKNRMDARDTDRVQRVQTWCKSVQTGCLRVQFKDTNRAYISKRQEIAPFDLLKFYYVKIKDFSYNVIPFNQLYCIVLKTNFYNIHYESVFSQSVQLEHTNIHVYLYVVCSQLYTLRRTPHHVAL